MALWLGLVLSTAVAWVQWSDGGTKNPQVASVTAERSTINLYSHI